MGQVTLTIDNQTVTVPAGATLLDAARQAGIAIPTLCHWRDCQPQTSCMVCVVRLEPAGKLVPACAYPAADGMTVSSEIEEVRAIRRRNLDLLLSEHLGDCDGPCTTACPAGMAIPLMIRQIGAGQLEAAIATIKRDIPLPATLGRICPAPCEGICRRKHQDDALAICQLKRFVADWDLARTAPWLPDLPPATGKRVAIVGAGPAGLSAAWFLRSRGHDCTLFERQARPGGQLYQAGAALLPDQVVLNEARLIESLGCEIRLNAELGRDLSLDELAARYDAVLIATGAGAVAGLESDGPGVRVDPATLQTSRPAIFAAGNVIQKGRLAIRSIGQAKRAALAIDQYLACLPVTGWQTFSCHIGKPREGEMTAFMAEGSPAARVLDKSARLQPLSGEQARLEASRCLHCDCRKGDECRLRQVCQSAGVAAPRLAENRVAFAQQRQTAQAGPRRVVYESGKCIRCGLCVQITARYGETYGLAFSGRGYEAFITVPLGRSLDEALTVAAAECVAACPTAALAFVEEPHAGTR